MEELSQNEVRVAAWEAIARGRVPSRQAVRTWGGSGNGARCAVCSRLVRADQLGFEVDFKMPGDLIDIGAYHMHVSCYHAWEALVASAGIDATLKGLKSLKHEGSMRANERGAQPSSEGQAEP